MSTTAQTLHANLVTIANSVDTQKTTAISSLGTYASIGTLLRTTANTSGNATALATSYSTQKAAYKTEIKALAALQQSKKTTIAELQTYFDI
jgi:hypothetical protein